MIPTEDEKLFIDDESFLYDASGYIKLPSQVDYDYKFWRDKRISGFNSLEILKHISESKTLNG